MIQGVLKAMGKVRENLTPSISVDFENKKEIKAKGASAQMCVLTSLGLRARGQVGEAG